jgi:hypothetical protein
MSKASPLRSYQIATAGARERRGVERDERRGEERRAGEERRGKFSTKGTLIM